MKRRSAISERRRSDECLIVLQKISLGPMKLQRRSYPVKEQDLLAEIQELRIDGARTLRRCCIVDSIY